ADHALHGASRSPAPHTSRRIDGTRCQTLVGRRSGDGQTPHSRESLASSTRWSFVSLAGKQGSRVLFVWLLALILVPRDFGIASLAAAYIAFIGVLQDQGFGSALVQKNDMTPQDVGSVFALNVAAGALLALGTFFLSPYLADLMHVTELSGVLRVLSISVLMKALSVTPQAQLMRVLRFRALAVADVGSAFIGGLVGIIFATLGGRYWSLVALSLTMDTVYCVVTTVSCGRPQFAFKLASIRGMWGYSRNAMAAQFMQYTSRNSDNLLVGRYLGATALGYYSLSYRLLMLPLQLIGQVAGRVAFPVLSRIQGDLSRVQSFWLRGTRSIACVGLPAAGLIAVSSNELIDLVLGQQWRPAAHTVTILSLVALPQLSQSLVGPMLLATGNAHWEFRASVVGTVTALTGFIVGLRWGIEGVASGYLVSSILMFALMYGLTNKLLGLGRRDQVRNLAPAVIATGALMVTYSAVKWAMIAVAAPEVSIFIAATSACALTYVLTLRLAFPAALREFVALAREIMPRWPRGARPTVPSDASPDGLAPISTPKRWSS
ncbi:MAG: Teichuronic acid biosynthesis protein TuaB, partial [Gammaproteobacteria bacterium]|nr:Teichuronic acid biosynthesis protein TuaB [Gammaproteobacteria bacterium]